MTKQSQYYMLRHLINEKDFSFIALVLTFFLLPLSINLSSIAFVVAVVLKIYQSTLLQFKLFYSESVRQSSFFALCFFCYIIANSIIQNDIQYTVAEFDRQFLHYAVLFIAPMLLREYSFNKLLIISLSYGLTIAIGYVLFICIITNTKFDQFTTQYYLDLHHTYLSLFLLFITNQLMAFVTEKGMKFNWLTAISIATFFFITFWLLYSVNSKVSVLVFVFLVIFYLAPKLSKKTAVKYGFVFLILALSIYMFISKLEQSYIDAFEYRTQIWEAAIEAIKQKPFFGNLQDSEKNVINFQHYMSGKYYFLDSNLNSHNQYLSITLKFGIIGLIIFFIYLFHCCKSLYKKKSSNQRLFTGFLLIMFTIFIIENILVRHHGIVLFAFGINYFLISKNE
tara:strand:- start:1643 stop:2827 length:1185 start_codon:yes stop_codon:yes gene_type:complete